MDRRTVLKGGVAMALPSLPATAGDREHPIEKVRRLGREMSVALKDVGDYEYAYIRPAGTDFPVLLANKTQPGHSADMFFAEYYEAITEASGLKRERHIRQLSALLSELLDTVGEPNCLVIRPKSVGSWASYSLRDI